MAKSNLEIVGNGLEILRTGLGLYVVWELQSRYRDRWRQEGGESRLRGAVGKGALAGTGSYEQRFALLDVQTLIGILHANCA